MPDLIPYHHNSDSSTSSKGRRKIQNRVNQRAFRQRRKTGSSVRDHRDMESMMSVLKTDVQEGTDLKHPRRPRLLSDHTASAPESRTLGKERPAIANLPTRSKSMQEPRAPRRRTPPFGFLPPFLNTRTVSAPASAGPGINISLSGLSSDLPQGAFGGDDPGLGLADDELSLLIQRNVMDGARTNAQHLGINPDDLLESGHGGTISRQGSTISHSLKPGTLQSQVQHDPMIDILPDPRLRHQLVEALAAGTLDQESFCAEIRRSGELDIEGFRSGLLCWGPPDDVGGWEMSEHFARRWSFVLQGCERLLDSTNAWRLKRYEKAIALSY